MKLKLKGYQKEGVLGIEAFGGRALLADEQGLGKTIQAAVYLRRNPQALPAVIVCRASLKDQWKREVRTWMGADAQILSSMSPPPNWRPRHVNIINYNILDAWLPTLQKWQPRCVIIDECQDVANRSTQQSKACRELCKGAKFILGLSGTALVNKPAELWPILNMLLPKHFPSFTTFVMRYARPRRKPWGWDYGGAKNLDELHRLLKRLVMIRRLKSDVLQDLPQKRWHVRWMKLSDPHEYREAELDFVNWLSRHSHSRALRARKAEQLAKMMYLKRLVGKLKYKSVVRWVEDFMTVYPPERKLLLFCVHRKFVEALQKRFGDRCVHIYGGTPVKKRQAVVDTFQHDPRVRLFVGNDRAGGVGLNLTAARDVAVAELGWTPGGLAQVVDRAHRIGQEHQVNVHLLLAKGTIDEDLWHRIDQKRKVLDQVLDGGEDKPDTNIMKQVTADILRRNR